MSALYPLRFILPALDRLLSQKATAVRIWCWPTVLYRIAQPFGAAGDIEADGNAPVREIDLQPGASATIYQDEEVTFLLWSGQGPEADKLLAIFMNFIERAGLSASSYGADTGSSGYAVNQLIAAARMRFKPIVAHAQRAIEKQLCVLLDIIENYIKQDLHIYQYGKKSGWLSLGPSDIMGYRNVQLQMNPILPTDSYARSSMVINEVNAKLRSRESGMEMIGIEQPDQETRRILVEDAKESPEFKSLLTQEALKRAGLQLAMGGMSAQQLQSAYPNLPPGLQQTIGGAFEASAPPGRSAADLGMTSGQGMQTAQAGPVEQTAPGGVPMQATQGQQPGGQDMASQMGQLQQAMGIVQQIAQVLGKAPEEIVQQLLALSQQTGIPVMELLANLAQQVLGEAARTGGSAMAPGMAPGGPMTMATPNTEASPHVGRVVRPSGVATGMAPGPRKQGME